jgi:hypothetical protein
MQDAGVSFAALTPGAPRLTFPSLCVFRGRMRSIFRFPGSRHPASSFRFLNFLTP